MFGSFILLPSSRNVTLSYLPIAVGIFLWPGSSVLTQVESPSKISEIFYDLPCTNLFKLQNGYFEGGRTQSTDLRKDEKRHQSSRTFIGSGQSADLFVFLTSSCGGTDGFLRQ
jgi:hypothetical protein